jgi:filamentous hemagglutinin family protein
MQRKDRRSGALRPKRVAVAVSAAFLPWMAAHDAWADPAASQLPTGAQVGAGTVSISTTGTKLQIDQASDRAIINWQNFSIGSSGWVNFSQPSASAVVLNRSMQPAEIFGRLSANGQVFVTSQSGVYFARSAQVDVGGLVASNLSIRDQDFLAGRYVFSNEGSSGKVVNDGQINITTVGGYAALAGTQVQNNGVIVALAGTVALAAGDRITLDMVGDGLIKVSVDAATLNALALNAGTIQADGGRVVLSARSANALLDTVINNTGVIRARSLVERNGEIVLDGGGAGAVVHSGSLDASGGQAGTTGGTVSISGQYVAMTEGSTTNASGDAGGGTVTVKASDAAFVYGSISARDSGGAGKGGNVETSGKYLEVTQAPEVGAGGTWLIDPYNIDVVAVAPPPGFSNNTGPTAFVPVGDNSQIAASLITSQLNAGASVTLDTGGAGSPGAQAGDIRVLAAIDKTVANSASLALNAFHDVQVNQPINIASAFGPTGFGTLTIDAGNQVVVSAPITTSGGGLSIRAGEFINQSAINNGVGGDLKPGMAIFADRFNLAGGTINGGQGSVGLFTRTATNTVGVESAGDTTITNADIASVTLSPDSPSTNANQLLIGVGSAGSIRVGDNAQVNGGSKNLVFSAGGGAGTRVTVGANGLTTNGDVVVDATGGAIGGAGTIGGNRVQLIASTGIGTSTARVGTAATTLAARTTGGSAFIAEADDVRLGTVTIAGRTVTNGVAPGNAYDLTANGNVAVDGVVNVGGRLNLNAGGTLSLNGAGALDSQLIASGGQTISAQAITMNGQDARRAVIQNVGTGNQTLTVGAGGIDMNVIGGAGVAQIANNATGGNQTVTTTGALRAVGGSAGASTGSGLFLTAGNGKQTATAASIELTGASSGSNGRALISNSSGTGDQEINVTGTIRLTGGAGGLANQAIIVSSGNQTVNGSPDIILNGGNGVGTIAAGTQNSATIQTNVAGKTQNVTARSITATGGLGTDASAGLSAPNQVITVSGDVLLTGGAGNSGSPIARIGGVGTPTPSATNLVLSARDVILKGGEGVGAEAGLGSTVVGGAGQPNTITVNATRDVILDAGSAGGARIGTSLNFATPATGDISVSAGRDIQLKGGTNTATIRTAGNVTLNAGGSISENQFNAVIAANSLASTSGGNTSLIGDNRLGSYGGFTTGGSLSLHNAQSLTITGPISSADSLDLTVQGDLTLSASGTQDATVTSRNGQTIVADSLALHAQNGRRAVLQNFVAGDQAVSIGAGGIDLSVVNGAGVAQIVNTAPGGNQTVTTAGSLNVVGGSAAPSTSSGIFVTGIGGGTQNVNVAGSITLTAADLGVNGGALISTTQGDQTVSVGGDLTIAAGAGGNAGLSGAFGAHQAVSANNISITNAVSGGNNSVGFILGSHQLIEARGDITLTARGSGGNLAGIRIGGGTNSTTDLNLHTGRDLVLTGGTAPNNGVGIGSSAAGTALRNDIAINADRDVILNGGGADGSSARIGSGPNGVAEGNVFIGARNIVLNGGVAPAVVRTADLVTLSARGDITESGNAFVQAGSLATSSIGTTNLAGPNVVGVYNGSAGGDLSMNNSGTFEVFGVNGSNVTLAATGTGADLDITCCIQASGSLTLDAGGAVRITASGLQNTFVSSFSGQTVNARALLVSAQDGRVAQLSSNGGNQAINISGGDGVDVLATSGSFAGISNNAVGGSQSIIVVDAAHINVNGGSVFSAGDQSVSITGSGANIIAVGGAGTQRGSAITAGRNQSITAGTGTENGSITITGPAGAGTGISGFVTNSGVGTETQTVSTSGVLRVTGGTALAQLPNLNSGIFHNRQGQQTITAADVVVEGGASGSGNGAFISTNGPNPGGPGGGDQVLHVSGSITLNGSETGTNNRALITANRNQTINGNADIVIHSGASGISGTTNAAIAVNTPGMQQTINARNITMSNAASGGIDSVAGMFATNQVINASGNVTLTGGGSGGTLAGVRIGGAGGAVPQSTTLIMNIGGDLVLTGGAANNGVGLGSSAVSSQANNITIHAGGNVILNEGSGSGARIGGAVADPGAGNIVISAGGNIALNGVVQRTAIRTNDNVTLSAGGKITEAANGFVAARELTTSSGGNATLTGPNQVSRFTASTTSGDASLRNSAAVLTLGTMDLPGTLTIDQTGALAVPGTVSALNQTLNASGNVTIGDAGGTSLAGLFAPGAIMINTPQSIILRGSDSTAGGASLVAANGLVTLNAGELHLTGGAAPLAAASVLGGELLVTAARDITLTSGSGWSANALLYSVNNITMTIGGNLFIDGGHTPGNWARVQTADRDGTITLRFPNERSGGFFVDGFEGKIKHGQDGFFTGVNKPAKLGDTLLLLYGG